MITKSVRIAVVGAGQIGWVIANMLKEQGHDVRLAELLTGAACRIPAWRT